MICEGCLILWGKEGIDSSSLVVNYILSFSSTPASVLKPPHHHGPAAPPFSPLTGADPGAQRGFVGQHPMELQRP